MYKIIMTDIWQGSNNPQTKGCVDSMIAKYPQYKEETIIMQTLDDSRESKNLNNFGNVLDTLQKLANKADEFMQDGNKVLMIGGDHSVGLSTIAAASKNIPSGERLGVFWMDAHGDMNNETISPSGNIHGMPLGFAQGSGHKEFVNLISEGPMISKEDIVLFGCRDIDADEMIEIKNLGIKLYEYSDIEEMGYEAALADAIAYLKGRGIKHLHLSIDLDGMNPIEIPGVTTDVEGGLITAQNDDLTIKLNDEFELTSVDVVEYNPITDKNDLTLDYQHNYIELVKSLK